MNTGKLDKKITFESYTTATNTHNESIKTWGTHAANVWASVTLKTGTETAVTDKRTSVQKATFLIRHRDGLNTTMRIDYNGLKWNIHSIIPDVQGRKVAMQIEAEARI